MRRNTPSPTRAILHEVLLPQALPLSFGAQPTSTAIRRSYDLERVFTRGTLIEALNANTDILAEQALDSFIASKLPPTSFDHSLGILSPFWLNLATCNGHPVDRSWKEFEGQKKLHVLAAIELAERDGWLFRLPFWPLPDYPDREPLIFFSDTGLHRRLIGLWEENQERKACEEEKKDPGEAAAIRRSVSHLMHCNSDLRFQGFVTHALAHAVPDARPYVFDRPSKGEIDLILDCPKGDRWAVEITNGKPSEKPSKPTMFTRICEELGIDKPRRRVVYRASTATPTLARTGVIASTLPPLLAELTGRLA